MSILIKAMEMPSDCAWCRFLQSTDPIPKRELFCGVDTTNSIHDYKPDKGCPLVPVQPHGRLIDADAFLRTIRPICDEDAYKGCTFETVKRLMIEHISDAPTIIEAES